MKKSVNPVTVTLVTLALLTPVSAQAQTLRITRGGARPVQPAAQDNFTGSARVETLFEAVDPGEDSRGGVGGQQFVMGH